MRPSATGWTIADYASAYRNGLSPVDAVEDVLAALAAAPRGVLIGEPLADIARADAAHLTTIDPTTLPLYGVPFVVKDNIDVATTFTTAGCPGFATQKIADAFVVGRLRAAGAIIAGKTNLDQFATGLVGTRSPYGTPPNVLDRMLAPGGSSSGSAVAVALGLVPFALGTDTAGSGRVPAAFNGIVGVKPTVGSASIRGIVPAVRRFDCPSVFARTVADATAVAGVVRGFDADDPFSRPAPPVRTFRSRPIVGVPRAWPPLVDVTARMRAWFDDGVRRLVDQGAEVREVDIAPLLAAGSLLYGSAIVAERTASVGAAVEKAVDGLDPVVASIIGRGSGYTAIDAYATEYELRRLQVEARTLWEEIDVLALPVTPSVATLAEIAADPIAANEALGAFTTFVNLLDLAAIVVPVVSSAGSVPAGLQLIGPAWSDDALAGLALAYESGAAAPVRQSSTIVVVGAHLEHFPLNHQLVDRHATLLARTATSPDYRLFALAGTTPPKPGLVRVGPGEGASIAVELWSMSDAAFGSFVQQIPPPLCIGSVTLADGSQHKGFLCEPAGLDGATDITRFGGWRAYTQQLSG